MFLSKTKAVCVMGAVWALSGSFLLFKGLQYLALATKQADLPLIRRLTGVSGGVEQAALLLISIALFVGFLKGRMVLSKVVKRGLLRLSDKKDPIAIKEIFSKRDLITFAVMMSLGMAFNLFGLVIDIRGAIDVAVGSALVNGSLLYFKSIYWIKENG